LVQEGDGAVGEVPHHPAKGDHPLSPQDEVIPHERHDEEVDEERLALDDDRGAADDARASDALTIGHGGREARARLDRQAGAAGSVPGDEIMCGAGVQERDEGGGAQGDPHLHGITDGHTGHCPE
jgi:hypothetical protein